MIPDKLSVSDKILVVSPARSLSLISESVQHIAVQRLNSYGYDVLLSDHAKVSNDAGSSEIKDRVYDLHAGFSNPSIKMIMSAIGGFNSNELLPHLDYDLIRDNPKILLGYSDITALQNAIYAKTGLVTYSGPHFSSFGEEKHFEYSAEYFKKCLVNNESYTINPSTEWSEDKWYRDQTTRKLQSNLGIQIIRPGKFSGTILGGNLSTFALLHGTPYMPVLNDSVLFLEDDEMGAMHLGLVDRHLESLTQQPGFQGVRGIVFGRLSGRSPIELSEFRTMLLNKPALASVPMIYGVDFGHTEPRITFPIGGKVAVTADTNTVTIEIREH